MRWMSRNLYNKTKRYPRKSRIPFSFNVFALRTGCISSLFKAFFVTRSTFVRLPCRRKAFLHQNPTILIVLYCKISAERKKAPSRVSFLIFTYYLFLPGHFAAFGAFHISCSTHMHCPKNAFKGRDIFMSAGFALIVAGGLLDSKSKHKSD